MDVEHLKNYKENCYSALSRDLTEFEKNFLLVAGAILAFSITFIKDIIKISETEYLFLLFIGWGLIIISIGIMMHAFLKSADTSDLLWKEVDNFIGENNFFENTTKLSDSQCIEVRHRIDLILTPGKLNLRKKRKFAVNIFLIGIVSFSLFVSLNLVNENHIKNSNPNSIKKVSINDTIILQNQKQ